MTESKRKPNLFSLIIEDLWQHKMAGLLLLVVMVSAFSVVWTTHHTRMLVESRELLMMERDALNVEWRHLLIEQNALAEHSRIEAIARKQLGMQRPKLAEQVVVKTE